MAKKNTEKSQRQQLKIILYFIAVVTVAMVIEILILNSLNRKNSNRTSLVLLNQVVSIIEENEQSENELIETLKEDFIIRAQTVSYILDSKPEAQEDISELEKIAEMMQIDEIHLFDETGEIYSGTEPEYYGYNFDSGEQMSYFKPMLKDKKLSMCQDITPNTAEGKNMMYAITWSEAGDKMIQVGIEPVRLLAELRRNEIPEVVDNMPAYSGIHILVADADTKEIYGSTNSKLIEKTLDEVGITDTDFEEGSIISNVLELDGEKNYCKLEKTGEYIVVVAASNNNSKNFYVALVIEFVYLLVAGLIILYMIERLLRATDEKSAQLAVLVSMSDVYNSMHVIDLKSNTMMEYNARQEVSKVAKQTIGADMTLKKMINLTTEEDYLDAALEFTDIHTISDRMQNRKIISHELVSKAIGWYRASFVTIEKDEEGRPTKVIYLTRNIDKQKRREEELIIKSNVDELTGLYNRHAYEDDIAKNNDTITENDFVFVSLDVNGLKTVNDTLGHVAGDELITGAANCMKRCFGPYGRIYRTGGDEFAAIIFANEVQLESIKKNFEKTVAIWSGRIVKSLSVSCGYVRKVEVETISVHEIAHIADKRMYEVKSAFYEKNSKRSSANSTKKAEKIQKNDSRN
jgi:diguanylate cyclase (GGDEF)-like protein